MNAELNSFAIVFIGLVLFVVIPYCVFIAHRDSLGRANEEIQTISGVITRQKKPSSLAIKVSTGEIIFHNFKTRPWSTLRGAVVGDTVEVKYFENLDRDYVVLEAKILTKGGATVQKEG